MHQPSEILLKYWGHAQFRPNQEEIINGIIAGTDTLALLPTGGGKSICFQVPALCMDGICLVVSPLLALMDDQVKNLRKRNISAFAITSALHSKEIDRILDNCVYGEVKFLYVSPERLQNELFLERFKKMKPSFIAVDEAHCISQWGYDFRPEYLKIAEVRTIHPNLPVLALTASATPAVVSDIQDKLHFKKSHVIASSFARSNVSYNVNYQENKESKILEICRKMRGSGIVYCGTRLRTKELEQYLQKNGISSASYHAGMSVQQRSFAFNAWMKNDVRMMCATNAFGMGIDKPDVRLVLHADVPNSPEAYFQEAGRAGRDGQKAYAVLIYNESDLLKLNEQIAKRFPEKEFIRKIYKSVGSYLQLPPGTGKDIPYRFNPVEFCKSYDYKYAEVVNAFKILELSGYFKISEVAFLPSRIYLRIGRQDLYSYQVANPSLDPVIKVLLRMYGGLFEQYVSIREEDIAKNLRLDLFSLKEKLELLKSHQVIDYVPQSDIPLLTFLTGRMHEDSLIISPDVYDLRKKREEERLYAMEKFLHNNRCRSLQLLDYFGEKSAIPCGICDVCRDNIKHGLQPAEFEELNNVISEMLLHKEFTLEELPGLLPTYSSEHLIEFVRWKLDIGEFVLNDRLYISLPGLENE